MFEIRKELGKKNIIKSVEYYFGVCPDMQYNQTKKIINNVKIFSTFVLIILV